MSSSSTNPTMMTLVEENFELSLDELGRVCRCDSERIVTLVHEGVLQPLDPAAEAWRFGGDAIRRARRAVRLMSDLDLNPPGAALALELLDRIESLERRLADAQRRQANSR